MTVLDFTVALLTPQSGILRTEDPNTQSLHNDLLLSN